MEFLLVVPWHTGVFALLTLGWWAEFVLFPSRTAGKGGDPTFLAILRAILLAILLALALSWWGWGNLGGNLSPTVGWLSLVTYAAGLTIRYWSLMTLGAWFTRAVETSDEQILVSSGPYRFLRHPSYLGLLLLALGALLFIRNLPGLVLGGAAVYVALERRMNEEELLMEKALGQRYRRWKEQRGRLIPRLVRRHPRRVN